MARPKSAVPAVHLEPLLLDIHGAAPRQARPEAGSSVRRSFNEDHRVPPDDGGSKPTPSLQVPVNPEPRLPLVPIEAGIFPASPPESLTTEQLVEITVGTFQRVQDSMPYIIELRKRFKAAPRGKADIGGCDTWEQFCETHLHRTASALRKALQADRKVRPLPDLAQLKSAQLKSAQLKSIDDHIAAISAIFAQFSELNGLVKNVERGSLSLPEQGQVKTTLIQTLRKIAKDAAERADVLEAALDKVLAA